MESHNIDERMRKKLVLFLLIRLTLLSVTVTAKTCSASQYYRRVNIKADGSLEPATAPIQQSGDVYVLLGDVGSIVIEKSNIMIDGNGHTIQGPDAITFEHNDTTQSDGGVFLNYVRNVTVKNLIIQSCPIGISVYYSSNCTMTSNTIAESNVALPMFESTSGIFILEGSGNIIQANQLKNNYVGIYLGCNSTQNTITQNNITNSSYASFSFWESSGNSLYFNNLVKDKIQTATQENDVNTWDSGSVGNFWSDYNGSDLNHDGVGDTPYVLDANNTDHYPLILPFDINSGTISLPTLMPTPPESQQTKPLPTATIAAALGISIVAVCVGLTVYFKKMGRKINK